MALSVQSQRGEASLQQCFANVASTDVVEVLIPAVFGTGPAVQQQHAWMGAVSGVRNLQVAWHQKSLSAAKDNLLPRQPVDIFDLDRARLQRNRGVVFEELRQQLIRFLTKSRERRRSVLSGQPGAVQQGGSQDCGTQQVTSVHGSAF